MKTTKKILIFIAFIAITLTSCSKDDNTAPVTYQEENPMPGFLATSGFNFNKVTASSPGNAIETGFSFIPKVKGKIKAIVGNLHAANPNLSVTIWDKSTGLAIATNYINLASANTEVTKSISEIVLQKDKEYVFSIKTQYYFVYEKQNNANQTYPVTVGNISITGNLDGDTLTIPNFPIANSFTGDFSFVFQQVD